MSLFDWFQDRWKSETVPSTYVFLDGSRVEGRAVDTVAITSGDHYFQITLAQMFLRNNRKWFTDYSPAVYSVIGLKYGNSIETLSHVAGPSGLKDVNAASVNTGVMINYALTPLTPYNGGTVEIEAGLVALPGSNDAKRLLKVLTDVSKSLAVPQLSVALGFAQPLVDGITELVGSNETKLVLRLHDAFTQSGPLKPGYLVCSSAPDGALDRAQMWVKGDRLHYGATQAAAVPLVGRDFVLLRIDASSERDDYHAFTLIDEPFQAAVVALGEAGMEPDPGKQKEKLDEADRLFGAAKIAVYQSKDLTARVGRRQAIESLKRDYAQAKSLLAVAGAGEAHHAKSFADVMSGAISVAEAKSMGEITASDII